MNHRITGNSFLSKTFQITEDHIRWANSAGHKRLYGKPAQFWIDLIKKQGGKCALTQAPLFFDKKNGTPLKGGPGCHPLYAAVDHIAPRQSKQGFQILCYDINDLKGHLPSPLFNALTQTKEWKIFAEEWRKTAESSGDRGVLKRLIEAGSPQI